MSITSWIRRKKQKTADEIKQIRTDLSRIDGTTRINLAKAEKKLVGIIRRTGNNPKARKDLIDAMNFISNLATNLDKQSGVDGKKAFSTMTKNLYDNTLQKLKSAEEGFKRL